MINEWTGVLAVIGKPSADGRTLAMPERLLSRPLPLPLAIPGGQPVGAITALSIHADQLRAHGTIRAGILTPGQPAPVGLDVDQVTAQHHDLDALFTTWRITGATLLTDTEPAWPQALIRMKEEAP